jgi:hypothetical protein
MSTLSVTNRFLAYEDQSSTNNPQQRPFDWSRQMQGVPIDNPACDPYRIQPLKNIQVFDGSRTLSYDSLTQYSIEPLNTASNRYRLKWTGVGASPVFRIDRAVGFASGTVTITPQLNQCVVVTASAGAIFGSVVAGDVVYVPGLSTGDSASVFDPMNEGIWSVLSATSTTLVLGRNPGVVYSSLAQTVTVSNNALFQVFSSDGVQLDDTLNLLEGFSPVMQQMYEIVGVTATSIDFVSGVTLPPTSTVVPGLNSIVIFENAKSWIALETDQNINVAINGSITSFTVEPILAGDPNKVGFFQLMGTIYSLNITNKSTLPATIRVLSAE